MNFQVSFHLTKDRINALIQINEKFEAGHDEHRSVSDLMSVAHLADIEQFRSLGLLEVEFQDHYGRSPWFYEVFDQMVTKVEQEICRVRNSLNAAEASDLGGRSVIDLARFAIPGLTIVNARVLLNQSNIHEWAPQRILMEYIGSKIEG